MKKGNGVIIFALVLAGIMLIMPFASANWFTDLFSGKSNAKVTGNAVYDSSNGLYNGLISYYNFENYSKDVKGVNNGDAVSVDYIIDGSSWVGKFSGNSRVDIGTRIATLNISSISTWVKFSNVANNPMIYGESQPTGIIFALGLNDKKLGLWNWRSDRAGNWAGGTSNTVFSTGQWYHVVTTFSKANGLRIYVNGNLDNSIPSVNSSSAGVSVNYAGIGMQKQSGSFMTSNSLNGNLDDFMLFNRELSASDVVAINNSGRLSAGSVTPTTCTSFTYSAWSTACIYGQNLRTVNSSFPTGCTGGSPVLTRDCDSSIRFMVQLSSIDYAGIFGANVTLLNNGIEVFSGLTNGSGDLAGNILPGVYSVQVKIDGIVVNNSIHNFYRYLDSNDNYRILITPTTPVCGNHICETGETATSCASDCGGTNSNNICPLIGQNVKDRIQSFKTTGFNVTTQEGRNINLNDAVVIYSSVANKARLLQLDNLGVGTSTSDKITFSDVLTQETFQFSTGLNNRGSLNIDGLLFYISSNPSCYFGVDARICSANLTWGTGATSGNPGTQVDTFDCDSNSQTQVCQELVNNKGVLVGVLDDYILTDQKSEEFGGDINGYINIYQNKNNKNDVVATGVYVRQGVSSLIKDHRLFAEEIRGDTFWELGMGLKDKYATGDDANNDYQYYIFGEDRGVYHLWYNQNVIVFLVKSDEGTDKSIKDITDFIDKIQNNNPKTVINYNLRTEQFINLTNRYIDACPSEVNEPCEPIWQKKVEPAICPEYGRQTVIYEDLGRCNIRQNEKNEMTCSPGMCSGCLIPNVLKSSFEGELGSKQCIPYGTRLGQQKDVNHNILISEGYKEETEYAYTVDIYNSDSANVKVEALKKGEDGSVSKEVLFDSYVSVGGTYVVDFGSYQNSLKVVKIVTSANSNDESGLGYVEFSLLEDFNAFCSYNGNINEQKGDDASCQNNYECSSNECRNGQCVNSYVQSSGQGNILVQILCFLLNPISSDDRAQCVVEFSGGSSGSSAPTTTSSGGSGSSGTA